MVDRKEAGLAVFFIKNNRMYSPLLPPSPAGLGYPELRFPFYPPGRLAAYRDLPGQGGHNLAGAAAIGGRVDNGWAGIAPAKDPNIQV